MHKTHWATTKIPGMLLAVVVFSAATIVFVHKVAPRTAGTSRTTELTVDHNATVNGAIISSNPTVTIGQPVTLTPQLSENVSGTLWNSNDMRTDGNLEVGAFGVLCGGAAEPHHSKE